MIELITFSVIFIVLYVLLFIGVLVINYTMVTKGEDNEGIR